MARDLIPPPSPAGRPEQPGGGTTETPAPRRWLAGGETALRAEERAEQREDVHEPPPEPRLPADSPYRPRFGFLFGALIGVLIAAAALAYVLAAEGGTGAPEGWSAWKPASDDRLEAAQQIAGHVAPKYRLETGDQLVAITAGDLEIANLPLDVVMRSAPVGGDIQFIEGDGVLYTLNGLGPRGSIEKGRPSEERHLLLRREALELALYTFRYAKDVDLVVALLPPPPPDKGETLEQAAVTHPLQALFFRSDDLKAQLDAPSMQITMPELHTPRPTTLGREAARIESLTRPNLFAASFRQGQDARAFLVLDRIPD